MKSDENFDKILFVSTFPPRECGIATFTKDLSDAIDNQPSLEKISKILAINNNGINIYNYPKAVVYQISDNDINGYIETAKQINNSESIKLVSIQHEFGIFGGELGDHLLAFLEVLNKPTTVTFHSILPKPTKRRKDVVKAIANRVNEIVVMTPTGVKILEQDYQISTPIRVIPHGIPDINFEPQIDEKINLGLYNYTILSSFGLLNPSKGYEYVIAALPEIIEKYPNILYLIVGETHPILRAKEGEKYRNFLEKKIKSLNLQRHVKFYNKYITKEEITQYLKATDIYISPSLTKDQITSGTLVNAMGCGRAVISTPFIHARDTITGENGLLVEFKNSKSFTEKILELLEDKQKIKNIEIKAFHQTRSMTWKNVAKTYNQMFNNILTTPIHTPIIKTLPYNSA